MILASLCNIKAASRSPLVLFEEDLTGFRHVKLHDAFPKVGITGMACTAGEIILASQAGAFVIFDRGTLREINALWPKLKEAPHSILLHENVLYCVITGRNTVIAVDLIDRKLSADRIYWKVSEQRSGDDYDHLNSICLHQGEILVSGFGPRIERLWSSCKNGFIWNPSLPAPTWEGLCQPHSVTSTSKGLVVCESAKSRVLNLSSGQEARVNGYVRGFCETDHGFYVTVSKGRTASKSTGLTLTNPEEGSSVAGTSAIYLLDKDTLAIINTLETGGLEYYDLIQVGAEARSWPLFA